MKAVLNVIDILSGRLLAAIMIPLLYISMLLFALAMPVWLSLSVFEYQSGLDDLDSLEALLLLLLSAVSIRFFWRSQQQRMGVWWQLKRFIFVVGFVSLVYCCIGFFSYVFILYEEGQINQSDLVGLDDLEFFAVGVVLFFSIFAAAPLPPLFNKKLAVDSDDEGKVDEPPSFEKDTFLSDSVSDAPLPESDAWGQVKEPESHNPPDYKGL
jgi:hypothetical protein